MSGTALRKATTSAKKSRSSSCSNVIKCLFCGGGNGINAGFISTHEYQNHLINDHKMQFDVEFMVERTLKIQFPHHERRVPNAHRPTEDACAQVDLLGTRSMSPLQKQGMPEQDNSNMDALLDKNIRDDGPSKDAGKVQVQTSAKLGKKARKYSKLDPLISDWSHQCLYKCKICEVSLVKYKIMWKHLKDAHSLSLTEYKRKFGNLMQETRMHVCAICSKKILHSYEVLKHHFEMKHQVSLQSYFWTHVASDLAGYDWKNGCIYHCAICKENHNSIASFGKHLNLKHQMDDFSEYVICHGDPVVESKLFSCPVCKETMCHDGDDVSTHMNECHPKMSEEEYRNMYFASRVPNKPKREKNNTKSKLEWNHSVAFCPACPATFYSIKDLNLHLSKEKINPLHAICGPYHIHLCHICTSKVRCTEARVRHHLRRHHSVTLKDYERRYYGMLKGELSKAEAISRAVEHPGYDENYSKKQVSFPSGGLWSRREVDRGCNLGWNLHIFFCPACPAILHSRNAKNKHLYNKKIDISSAIPGPYHIHKCYICKKEMKCSNEKVKYHLKFSHAMTLQDYELKFLDLLRDELSRAEKKLRTVKHPGYDPDFMKHEVIKASADLDQDAAKGVVSSDPNNDAEANGWNPVLVNIKSIPE